MKAKKIWFGTVKKYNRMPINIAYRGDDLESATRYYWRVQVWDAADQNSGWSAVQIVDAPRGTLRVQSHDPIQIVRRREPGTRTEPEEGIIVFDTGQNLSGWATVTIDTPEGMAIELFYSEKIGSTGKASTEGNVLVSSQVQTD